MTYQYDDKGRLVALIHKDKETNSIINRKTLEYDANQIIVKVDASGTRELEGEYLYLYDDDGLLQTYRNSMESLLPPSATL